MCVYSSRELPSESGIYNQPYQKYKADYVILDNFELLDESVCVWGGGGGDN